MPKILTEVMQEYFGQSPRLDPMNIVMGRVELPRTGQLPLVPKAAASLWKIESAPRRLSRTYKFDSQARAAEFLSGILSHEAETGHFGRIICEFPHVTVEVRTHDLDDVTELDKEYAKVCDQVYEDVFHYRFGSGDLGEENDW